LLPGQSTAGGDCTAFGSERTGAQMIAPPNSVYLPCSGLWVFWLFTIAATKLPSYVLPLMPAVSVALLWSEELKVKAKAKGKIFSFSS